MIIGMDFGTTHSGMAVYDGHQLRTIPLDATNANERVTPTMLYAMNEQKLWFGREAMNTYFEHNLGRPVKLERIWIGEITLTFAEVGTFVRDVYIWIDVLSPGRLFVSFKTDLPDSTYTGTTVGRFFYSLEDIIATYLYVAKTRAERFLGQELDHVVLGRPVRFSENSQADALAQERLLDAAMRAGYKSVYFEYEPIAAAHFYETTLDRAQNVLVFDFGGGTLDITIMRLGDAKERQVLATSGVPIAGNIFDQRIVRAKIPKHFGEGSYYRSANKLLPIPGHIYDAFSDWRTILTLQTPDNLNLLRSIAPTAENRYAIEGLLNLITSNYSLRMYDVVERVKRQLSHRDKAVIRMGGDGFHVEEPITRAEFEYAIRPEYRIIERHLQETLESSGLQANEIDVVIRTGGSSQIPLFKRMLADKFGAEKVRALDTFGSVTSGLGVIAHGIETGTIEATAYQKSSRIEMPIETGRTNVPLVDLNLLKRQIMLTEGAIQRTDDQMGLALVTKDYHVHVQALPADTLDEDEPVPIDLSSLPYERGLYSMTMADLDEPLLLVTSTFRLLLVTLRELIGYKEASMNFADARGFMRGEQLCLVTRWSPIQEEPLLALMSSQGYVRTFIMEQMRSRIEGSTPPKIGWSQPGWPKALMGAEPEQRLTAIDSAGRGASVRSENVPRSGVRLLQKRKANELVAGLTTTDEAELLLLSTTGYASCVDVKRIPHASKDKPTGAALVRRRGEICNAQIMVQSARYWALTTERLVPISSEALRAKGEDGLLKMEKLVGVGKEEIVLGGCCYDL
ncbi:Hsp70 family protein [Chloroflexi bacterium TSY]|nr:Hsp70 family protein [Chloroflexi bacterium TSY]